MKINHSSYVATLKTPDQEIPWQMGTPQVAMYGRSNAGKSSAINYLLGRKALAASSSKPGKTVAIHAYQANDLLYLIDLPGYGYARMGKSQRRKLQELIDSYVNIPHALPRINVLVLDCRVRTSELDDAMLSRFVELESEKNEPFIVLMNKSDKLNQKEKNKAQSEMQERLSKNTHIIFFSSVKKKGREKFWNTVMQIFTERGNIRVEKEAEEIEE